MGEKSNDWRGTLNLDMFLLIGLCIVVVWTVQVLLIIFSQTGFSCKTLLNLTASACLAIGGAAYAGMILSSTVGLGRTHSFEWPIGKASGALGFADGTVVVAHKPSARLQIYDQSLSFKKGWGVDAGGGTFSLIPGDENSFYVFTARGKKKYHYTLDGTLTASTTYQHPYPEFDPSSIEVDIPTPIYKRIFSSPIVPALFIGAGIVLLIITGTLRTGKQ